MKAFVSLPFGWLTSYWVASVQPMVMAKNGSERMVALGDEKQEGLRDTTSLFMTAYS